MARIVIDARESGTSTGRYIDKLIESLYGLKPKHEIIILTKEPRMQFLSQIAPDFKIIHTPYSEFSFGEQLGFKKQLKTLRPDLVHFGMVQQPLLYMGRVVTTMNDLTTVRFRNPAKNWLVFTIKQQIYKFVNIAVAHKTKHIITFTAFVKQDVAKYTHVSPDKISAIHLAADKIVEKPESVASVGERSFIMYVGRPLPHKNLERLMDAFAVVKKTHPELSLVIAGKKDILMDQLEQKANMKGISDVIFTGFVSDAQLRWLYEHTSAYIFPSLSEGFGLPGLEAMVHGAPVISSNATCLPEVYGDAAKYFDPLSVGDMAAAITEVLDNKTLRDDLIARGKKQAARYSWETTALLTFDIYKKALQI